MLRVCRFHKIIFLNEKPAKIYPLELKVNKRRLGVDRVPTYVYFFKSHNIILLFSLDANIVPVGLKAIFWILSLKVLMFLLNSKSHNFNVLSNYDPLINKF